MRRLAAVASMLTALTVAGGCGKPAGTAAETGGPPPPQNIVLEREISGSILGQRLGKPYGVAVDGRGFLYATDGANNRVIRFLSDFTPELAIGGLGSLPGNFDQPGDIDVDRAGNAFVCDMRNKRVVRLDAHLNQNLEIQLMDPTEALKYGEASGIAVGDNGEIWMTDRERHRVAVFDLAGTFQRFVGDIDAGKGALSQPTGIAYRGKDGFVVCDTDLGRLVYFDQYGNYLFHLDLDIFPSAVAIDAAGNAWVLEAATGQLVYVIQTGASAHVAGPVLLGLRQPLSRPADIAVLGRGLLAVADSGNDRIVILRILSGPAQQQAN